MAGRVLRLGRKAEVDKRQSGIGEAACGGTRRKMEEKKEREGEMRNPGCRRVNARERGWFYRESFSGERYVRVLRVGKPTNRSIDPEPAARFLSIFFFFFPFFLYLLSAKFRSRDLHGGEA